jgi:hypothetical protein
MHGTVHLFIVERTISYGITNISLRPVHNIYKCCEGNIVFSFNILASSPGFVDLLSLFPCLIMTKLTSSSFTTPCSEGVLSPKLLRHLMTCWQPIVKCVFEDLRNTKVPNNTESSSKNRHKQGALMTNYSIVIDYSS